MGRIPNICPNEWNNLADTDEGIAEGIGLQAKYGDTAYTVKRQFDHIPNIYKFILLLGKR